MSKNGMSDSVFSVGHPHIVPINPPIQPAQFQLPNNNANFVKPVKK